jgi:hypothetical protein
MMGRPRVLFLARDEEDVGDRAGVAGSSQERSEAAPERAMPIGDMRQARGGHTCRGDPDGCSTGEVWRQRRRSGLGGRFAGSQQGTLCGLTGGAGPGPKKPREERLQRRAGPRPGCSTGPGRRSQGRPRIGGDRLISCVFDY